jgi:ketosteroid isomerase-like protein
MEDTAMTDTVTVGQDEALIRELVDARAAALRAGDPAALVATYTKGAVLYTLAPPLGSVGADEDGYRHWFGTFEGQVDYEVRNLEVEVSGDLGFCHSLNRLSATPLGMAEGFDLWFRATLGVRKVDGSWLVAHEHTSTPFYMDGSFKAAVDLKP